MMSVLSFFGFVCATILPVRITTMMKMTMNMGMRMMTSLCGASVYARNSLITEDAQIVKIMRRSGGHTNTTRITMMKMMILMTMTDRNVMTKM